MKFVVPLMFEQLAYDSSFAALQLRQFSVRFAASWYCCEFPELMRYLWRDIFAKSVGRQNLKVFIENMDWATKVDSRHFLCLPIFIALAAGFTEREIISVDPQ
jgi:hypothetical protein